MSMSERSMYLSKNVTLSTDSFGIVAGYQHKTKTNFSRTLDMIIKQWDKISIEIKKIEAEKFGNDLKKAKVIKQ